MFLSTDEVCLSITAHDGDAAAAGTVAAGIVSILFAYQRTRSDKVPISGLSILL